MPAQPGEGHQADERQFAVLLDRLHPAEAVIVKGSDPAYAAKARGYAQALYSFAEQYRGLGYSGGFYNSSFDEDELSWAAVWLYLATGT